MNQSNFRVPFETRYTLPVIDAIADAPALVLEKQSRIARWKAQRNAIVLAHNYQRPEVQDIADCVGDSLGLSQAAASTDAEIIVFCGVHFMAETAAILCPQKKVLLPDLRAQCSLAAAVTAEELRSWKARYPEAIVVAYINTSAEVKAESDYCCTSANAVKVVSAIPADRPVLFLPDKFLATFVARETKRRNILVYPGYCHVHDSINANQVTELLNALPDIELLLHPECGCVSSCMIKLANGSLPKDRTLFLSTEGMLRHVRESPAKTFAVGTEVGMLHRLQKDQPEKQFQPVNSEAVCAFMKTITLDNILQSFETLSPEVRVPEEISRRARRAIDRMLELA
jgi:quinolinate synthase